MKKLLMLFVLMLSLSLMAGEWHVKGDAANKVKFISSTPLLDFEGVTDRVDGYAYWEGSQFFGDNNEIYFEVDVNSLETGIGKRDRDLRNDVLESDKWPTTTFKGTVVELEEVDSGRRYNVIARGTIFIHGHEKQIDVPGTITLENGQMHIKANFSVFLKDYDIEAPSLVAFVKVAEEIKLSVKMTLNKAG